MPRCDALNLGHIILSALGWQGGTRKSGLKRIVLLGLALVIAGPAPAEEMKGPRISVSRVDWDAAAASLVAREPGTPAEAFAKLNVIAEAGFPGIANSTVPVLLPFHIAGFAKESACNPVQSADSKL